MNFSNTYGIWMPKLAKTLVKLLIIGVLIFPLESQSAPFYNNLTGFSSTLNILSWHKSDSALLSSTGVFSTIQNITIENDPETALSSIKVDSPALAKLKNKFQEPVFYRAELSHQFTDSYTGETTSSHGSIWFSKDMYKIDTPDQLILVRDRTSKVYNKSQNKVIISQYDPEADDFAPSRYFSGKRDTYNSTDIINQDGTKTIKIIASDAFELFTEVDIRLSQDGNPGQIDAIDQMGNTIRTTFRFGRFERIQEGVFAISYPSDAEIVDMRP